MVKSHMLDLWCVYQQNSKNAHISIVLIVGHGWIKGEKKMRLIDWDKVLEWMYRQKETTEQWSMRIAIENYVDDMPTVDAEPIRHGHWIVDEDGNIKCSECGHNGVGDNYCERCGAKMGA